MFSMLLATTGGIDWLEVVRPMKSIHWFYQLAFSFFILFVVIGVVNVLTGVFLENALELADRDLIVQSQIGRWEQFAQEMVNVFEELGPNRNGHVSRSALKARLES